MKAGIISYIKFSAAGLIASGADNLTYFLLNHAGIADVWTLTAARLVSLIVNFFLLKTAVFQNSRRQDSFLRYVLLVAFNSVIVYFLLEWLSKLLPVEPVIVKMGIEMIMQIFNYFISRFFIFRGKKEPAHEEE